MTNKQNKRRLLLFILVLAIPLMISIGLSLWIISDNIKVKPELEIEDVIIKYLDKNETEYDGNIQLPSNTYLGLANELTYYYKQLDDADYTLVDLTNRKGPINADDYLIKVVYYEEVKDIDTQEIITVEKTITGLTFKINKATIDTSLMEFNSVAKEYTGYPQSIAVSGVIPEEITNVTYEGSGINVGTYSITANFEYDATNYNEVKSMNATLTITQKDISKVSYKFTGNATGVFTYVNADIEEIKTSLVLTYGSINLIESTETEEKDYTITFENIKDVGTYTVYAHGIGNYKGELAIKYTIINAVLTITFDNETFTYTGSEIDLESHLTIKNAQGVDVTPDSLSYQHKLLSAETFEDGLPINATAYKVIITAEHAEYQTATKEIEVTIGKADISKADISLVSESYPYNGSAQNASISSVTFKADSAPQINLYMGDDYLNPTCANNTDAGTATITITGTGNFSGTAKKTYEITPIDPTINLPTISAFAEGGTPTIIAAGSVTGIDGATVNGELIMNSTTGIVYPTNSAATASVEITYSFVPSPSNKNYNSLINVTTTATMKAVAKIGSTYYGTIKKAVDAANSGTSKNVYVIHDLGIAIPVKETITIESGVKVLVTYDGSNYEVGASGISSLNATTHADANATGVTNNRKTLINLTNGADIIINSGGYLYLGGQTRRIGVTGLYTEINLDTGSSIQVSGRFECYGYVKENANSAKNSLQDDHLEIFDNSFDAERFINVTKTGTIKTVMSIYDFAPKTAATSLMSLNDAGVFPLNIFDFNNLQTYVKIDNGGSFLVQTYLIATTSVANKEVYEECPIVKSSGAMFNLTSGSCAFEYCPNDLQYTSTTGTTKIFVDGNMNQGSVQLSIESGIPGTGTQTITTANNFMPLSYNLKIYINNNGIYNSNGADIKFLPGSLLQINKGGKLNVKGDIIFYEGTSNTKIGHYNDSTDAVLINNGMINVESDGKIAAYIQTFAEDDTAVLDFRNCSSNSAFTVTSIEGNTAVEVTRTSEGYFLNEEDQTLVLSQFKTGTLVSSDPNAKMCWVGERNTVANLVITVEDLSYEHNIYEYEIYIADDAQGNNSALHAASEIPLGKYIKINVTRAAGTKFGDGTAHSSSQWYLIEKDIELIITPNEGILLTIMTRSSSGNGSTSFKVSECATQNGTFYQVAELSGVGTKTSAKSVYVVKGYYFKVVPNDTSAAATSKLDTSNYYYGLTETIDPSTGNIVTHYYPNPDGAADGDFITNSIGKFSTSSSYKADNKYTVYFHRKDEIKIDPCIAEGTLITLADGSKIPVEQLTGNELLLVWNHITGKMEAVKIAYIVDHDHIQKEHEVMTMYFNDGTTIKIIGEHVFYDATLGKYVAIDSTNYQDFIGHAFLKNNENQDMVQIKFITASIDYEITRTFEVVTDKHLINFTNDILSTSAYLDPLLNIFEINIETYMYNQEQMIKDIEEYGLYTYDDFDGLIDEKAFELYNAAYLKIAVGKGYITWEGILDLIDIYFNNNVQPII